MINRIIQEVSDENLIRFFQNKIDSYKPEKEGFEYLLPSDQRYLALQKIGFAELSNMDELLFFSCKYNGVLSERSSKRVQFEIAKKILNEDSKDGALFVFYDNWGNFRFSFIRRYYGMDQKYSNWKRFTYYVQPRRQNKTFKRQIDNCDFTSLDAIESAFNVEALSKEFYTELSHWYFASLGEVEFPNELDEDPHQLNSQAMIRLITRMMFVWFMKQKDLIPDEIFDKEYLDEILIYKDKTNSTYYKAILQNLFFATLNTPIEEGRSFIKEFQGKSNQRGVSNYYRYEDYFKDPERFIKLMNSVPFLNGGLFENLDVRDENNIIKYLIDCFSNPKINRNKIKVPDYLFFGTREADISALVDNDKKSKVKIEGLIDILNRFDFTIDENSPDDQEVALDPELLGTVFENLLASYNPETQSTARKESGSFYTPRPIVDYMVKESLFYYLQDKSRMDEEKLKLLLEANETEQLSEEEKQNLVEHLTHIKILDPACGSGAFPMGALQQLVRILNLLDPENTIYKEKLQEKLKQDLQQTIDKSNFEELKTNIEEVFANQYNDPDYARKLFLIQNCLYGVDIQSIAMQITKLRFFISLLVDQQIDRNQENYGVKPLPNLETKFVAANTLIGLQKQDGVLKNLFLQDLEDQLDKVREKYFNARTYKTKRKYRAEIKEIRNEISCILIADGWPNETAKQIAEWDPFDQNSSSSWFDPEWMFGVDKFDVVIGNPPYIQLQKALSGNSKFKYADLYKNEKYKTFARTGDIYALFYEKGIEFAKNRGLLCYITSNKWMRAKYGESLRKYFSSKEPLKLLDLGPGIFESATVDTNILVVRNNKVNKHNLEAITIRDKKQIENLNGLELTRMRNLSEDSWVILSPIEQSIKEKIEAVGTPLKDWDIKINYGIKTGFNQAFIIDEEVRKQLIKEDPKSAEIIRPILRGRDIKRYSYEFAHLYLITTFPSLKIDINSFPAIKKFLEGFKPKIKQTGQTLTSSEIQSVINHGKKYGIEIKANSLTKSRKKTNNKWYETQDSIDYWEDFDRQKIMYPNMTKYLPFYLDNIGFMQNDKSFLIVGKNIEFLVAFLNSSVFKYCFIDSFTELQGGTRELRKVFLEKIPIIEVTEKTNERFKNLITKYKDLAFDKKSTKELDLKIDKIIFNLYNLSYKERNEIGFIEIV